MNPVSNPEGFATGMSIFIILITAVSVIVPLGITGVVIYFVIKKLNANKEVIAGGEPAQAQVLSVQETGTTVNNQPELAIALQVQRQGQPPYQANTQAFVSPFLFSRLQVGSVVPVKVDPGNPLKVAVDTGALAASPVGAMGGQPPPGVMGGQPQPGAMGGQPAGWGAQGTPQAGGAQPACPYCGQTVPAGSSSCPYCGGQLG